MIARLQVLADRVAIGVGLYLAAYMALALVEAAAR